MPKLLFVAKKPFYPDSSGGAQKSSLYLFQSLHQLGWQIEVISALSLRSPYFRRACQKALMHLNVPPLFTKDEDLGYPCWRRLTKLNSIQQWLKWFDQRLHEYQPDAVLGDSTPTCPLLNHALRQGYPSFYLGRNINIAGTTSVIPDELHMLANSPFVASIISQITRKEVEVVLPFVDAAQYRVTERKRQYITFINPVPEKGIDVAIEVARSLPEERFLFVKGKWSGLRQSYLDALLKPVYSMPNVEVWENQSDMRRVYAVTDILLVPSQFVEAFGRVIIEAQVNGIPVVAAHIGGIPYTVGKGGILVEPKHKPEGYIEALRRLRTDDKLYAELSELALENSQRPEIEPEYQVKKFIRFVESRIEHKRLAELVRL